MLLEMQSAMNSMMSGDHLQSELSQPHAAGQAAPLTTAAEEAGPAPSPSGSSQSDSGSDSAVPMDTGSSSPSPSVSDSGEDEVIGSVTRAHQETFMYNQEQGSRAPEGPPRPPGGDFNQASPVQLSEQGRDVWNRRNNSVNMAGHNLLSILGQPHSQLDNQCPIRASRSVGASHSPAYIHGAVRAPPTEPCPGGIYSGGAWRGGSRMYLVRRVQHGAGTERCCPSCVCLTAAHLGVWRHSGGHLGFLVVPVLLSPNWLSVCRSVQ